MFRIRYLILILLFLHTVHLSAKNRKKILILHSYHQGLRWTDNVNDGIESVMDSLNHKYEIDYEYLDTKRNPSQKYLQQLIQLYDLKLVKEKYDALIVSDNNALHFVKSYGKKYFKNTPIVFCGINHFKPQLIEGLENITGVAEEVDWDGVINLMMLTNPTTNNLVIINDNKTTTAKLNKEIMLGLEKKYKKQLNFIYFEDYGIHELAEKVKQIKGDTSVLLLTFNKDKYDRFISFQDNLDKLIPEIKVPVYVAWAFYIGDGVLGGKVVSGKYHGKMAARMVEKILTGTKIHSIPIYRKPLDQYILNYNEIKRFNIDKDVLPVETILFNAPKSFYKENKQWIQVILIIIMLSTVIIVVLSRAIVRRIRAERNLLSEQNRLKISIKHERLLGIVGRLLNASEDFKNVIDDVLKLMTKELNVARISLYSLQNTPNAAVKIKSRVSEKGKNIKDVNQFNISEIKSIIDRLKMNKSIVSNDLSNLNDIEQEYYRKRNINSIVILPVVVEGAVVGLMGFSQNKKHHWGRDEISVFFSTVNMIANAWERNSLMNARLEAEQKNIETMRLLEESSRLASIGVMAAGITHEINQPLNAIKITADSVLFWQKRNPGDLPEMFTRKIKTISDGTSRIDAIIKHMRTFWEKPKSDSNEKIDMVEGVSRALSLVKRQINDHSIELKQQLPNQVVSVFANYIQFEQIIVNLVVNAIHSLDKIKKEDKQIKLSVTKDDVFGIIEIHDNGTGISEDIDDKIYDPLFSTKDPEIGSGLGMAIVKSFVDRFQGEITNYNNEAGGASFIVKFRLVK